MARIRNNWVALLFIVAVVATFAIGNAQNESANDQQRDDSILLCTLANERGALDAAFKRRTADARRASGDFGIAADYDAFALGTEYNLAIAQFIDNPEEAAQVEQYETPNGTAFRLTPHSKKLVAEGCERALRD